VYRDALLTLHISDGHSLFAHELQAGRPHGQRHEPWHVTRAATLRRAVWHLVRKLVVELDRERHQHLGEQGRQRERGRLPFLVALLALSPDESVAADERLFGELVSSGAWSSLSSMRPLPGCVSLRLSRVYQQ
jgi:hypothetical protein